MIRHGLQDPRRSLPRQRHRTPPQNVESRRQRLKSRYGDAVDVQRAADLYVQGWTLRQIGTELGVHWSTVSQQLRSAGISMRSAGPAAHPASTQQIVILRDQGMTWDEIAEQVGMTAPGVWRRYGRARPPKPQRVGDGSRCSPTPSINTLRLAYEQRSLIILVEPPRGRADCCPTSRPQPRGPRSCLRASCAGRRCGRRRSRPQTVRC